MLTSLAVAGFATGRLGFPRETVEAEREAVAPAVAAEGVETPMVAATERPGVDEILALMPDARPLPLAEWLREADAGELREMWAALHRAGTDYWCTDLLFSRWCEIDPKEAVLAAHGTSWWQAPWRSWAVLDPEPAFRYARGIDANTQAVVLEALGRVDPDLAIGWLLADPELAPNTGSGGIAEGLAARHPEEAIAWYMRSPGLPTIWQLGTWAVGDPDAAAEWMQLAIARGWTVAGWRESVTRALRRFHAERLPEMIEQAPSGLWRRDLEHALFLNTLERNPHEAVAQALREPSRLVALRRLSAASLHFMHHDAQDARAMLDLALDEDPFLRFRLQRFILQDRRFGSERRTVRGVNSYAAIDELDEMSMRLRRADQVATMEQYLEAWRRRPEEVILNAMMPAIRQWSLEDNEGCREWVVGRGPVREECDDALLEIVISGRMLAHDFQADAELFQRMSETRQRTAATSFIERWRRSAPEALEEWLGQQAPWLGQLAQRLNERR